MRSCHLSVLLFCFLLVAPLPEKVDAFVPVVSIPRSSCTTQAVTSDVDQASIQASIALLKRAAETKAEDSDAVVAALLDLEKYQRQQNQAAYPAQAEATLEALAGNGGGSWRLIFTTGTINTQERTGRINYFPLKATQSFRKTDEPSGSKDWKIENGIFLGDFPLVQFQGDFDWTVMKSGVAKLTFDFTKLKLLNFLDLQLKAGEAANLGAKTGLGSDSNVDLIERQGKRAFFNWISADQDIATARGGGGGLALWKRVEYEGSD